MRSDWLETKATEVVDRILTLREGFYTRADLIAYVRAVLDLTECRGAMRGSRELGEAMMGEKL
jgi:hypothetical protein